MYYINTDTGKVMQSDTEMMGKLWIEIDREEFEELSRPLTPPPSDDGIEKILNMFGTTWDNGQDMPDAMVADRTVLPICGQVRAARAKLTALQAALVERDELRERVAELETELAAINRAAEIWDEAQKRATE